MKKRKALPNADPTETLCPNGSSGERCQETNCDIALARAALFSATHRREAISTCRQWRRLASGGGRREPSSHSLGKKHCHASLRDLVSHRARYCFVQSLSYCEHQPPLSGDELPCEQKEYLAYETEEQVTAVGFHKQQAFETLLPHDCGGGVDVSQVPGVLPVPWELRRQGYHGKSDMVL